MPSHQHRKGEKKAEMIGLKIEPSDKATLIEICQAEDRPLGYVARELLLRGLAAYRKDTLLKEPNDKPKLKVYTAKTQSKPEPKATKVGN